MLLIGIVKKNAIMMIDFALDAERNEGKAPQEAIHQACLLRFRPILMTTMAALVGALPLMLGSGTGSELRHPLGLTIVGGLIVSQVLTLFTTPVIYLAFDRLGRAAARRAARHAGHRRAQRRGRETACREPVGPLHRPARRHDVADASGWRWPARSRSRSCRCRRCPRSIFRPSRSRPACPAPRPETVATSLTTPLERALGAIAGVTEMTSTSTVGNSRITLQFDLSRSIDGAARDVQAAINAARMDMPATCRSNPQYRKVNPADAPVLVLALTSETLGQGRLYDAASNVLQQKLSR